MSTKTLKASIIIGGSLSSSFRSAMSSTKYGLKAIGTEIAKAERKQRIMSSSMESFGRIGGKVADTMRRDYDVLVAKTDKLRAAQSRLADVQGRIARNAAKRRELGGALMGATMTAGAAVGAVLLPTNKAAEFNRQNILIGNTANMTRTQVAALGRTILDASRATNQSAGDVQRGIGFLVAAGLDAQRAQASIVAIGRTATAAGADIEDLARASFTLMDSLKIKPEGLQGALDILAVAGKSGNVELKDMAKQLPVLGASFAALKMKGREAAATMGAALEIARKGAGSADEAANNLRNTMSKLLAPETLRKAQKNFGLDLYGVVTDAQRNGANVFEAAMKSIMAATKGDQKAIGELFGDMQVQNFLRPMMQNWDEYTAIKNKALSGSAGATDRDFATMMQTASEQMRSVRNSAGRLALTFGNTMTPAIGGASDSMASYLNTASGFIEAHPKLTRGVVGATLALVGFRVATLGVRFAWATAKSPVLGVMGQVAKFRAGAAVQSMNSLGASGAGAASGFRVLGLAIAGVGVAPILAIGAAVGAIVVGALLVRKYWEPITAWLSGFFDGLRQTVGPAFDAIGVALAPLKPAWDAVAGAIGAAWDWAMKLVEPVHLTAEGFDKAKSSGQKFGAVVGGVLSPILGTLRAIANVIGYIVSKWDVVSGASRLLSGGGAGVVGGAMQLWRGLTGGDDVAKPRANLAMPAGARGRAVALPSELAGRGGATTTDNSSVVFNITRERGESDDELARRIIHQYERHKAAKRRSSIVDGVY